jgi:hypothetical protein
MPPAGIADRDEMSRHAASVSGSGGMSGTEQVPGWAASRGSLPGKMLVFQRRAVMLRVRMAGFSHELLNSSHDPVRKTGRDRVLNPLEPGFSHELPDNDRQPHTSKAPVPASQGPAGMQKI